MVVQPLLHCTRKRGCEVGYRDSLNFVRFQILGRGDVRSPKKGKTDKKRLCYHRKSEKQTKKRVETLDRLLWRAAAPGIKPLRLPRARDCAESCNSSVPRGAKVSAIDVTAKTIFEHSYLVPGPHQFALFSTMPSAPTPPPLSRRN